MIPLEAFLSWYDSLPLAHRQDIASFAFAILPGYDPGLAEPLDGMETRFKDHVTGTSHQKMELIGNILALRALIEFFFIRNRGTTAQWQETERFLAGAKAHFDELGLASASQTAEKSLTELEFRSEQWLRTTKKWQSLTSDALSDAKIEAWWRVG